MCGAWHALDGAWPRACAAHFSPAVAKSSFPAPMIIRDGLGDLDGLYNHADGRRYTSKRAFERAVADAGCVVVGNERIQDRPRPAFEPDDAAIEEAVCKTAAELGVSIE